MVRLFTVLSLALSLGAASVVSASAQVYGQYGAPSGSYQQSCNNIQMHGSTLSASCPRTNGQRVNTSLNLGRCNGGDISNQNGNLTCNGNGNGYGYNNDGYNNNGQGHHHHHHNDNNGSYNGNYNGNYNNNGYNGGYNNGYGSLPPGSYQQSCNNVQMRGSMLSGSCTAANGNRVYSTIDVSRCSNNAVKNDNGHLRCGY